VPRPAAVVAPVDGVTVVAAVVASSVAVEAAGGLLEPEQAANPIASASSEIKEQAR